MLPEDFFNAQWIRFYHRDVYSEYGESRCHLYEQFNKDCIALIRALNQGTQNQSYLCEQILNQNNNLFPKVVNGILCDRFYYVSVPECRAFLEAGGPRIGFLWLWNIYQNLKDNQTLNDELGVRYFLLFNEAGSWVYNPENLELVFEPFKLSRPPNPVPELARDFSADSDNFISSSFCSL